MVGFIYFLKPDESKTVVNIAYIVFGLSAVFFITRTLLAIPKSEKRLKLAWFLFLTAYSCWLLGDFIWVSSELLLGHLPFPSPADVFYFLFFPFIIGAILMLPGLSLERQDRIKWVLDISIIILSTGLLYWNFILGPKINVSETGKVNTALSILYATLSLTVFYLIIILLTFKFRKGRQTTLILLAISLFCFFFGESSYAYLVATGNYETGNMLDISWMLFNSFAALAAIYEYNTIKNKTLDVVNNEKSINYKHFLSYFSLIWLIPVLLTIGLSKSQSLPTSTSVIFIWAGIIIVITIARQAYETHLNFKLNQLLISTNESLEMKVSQRTRELNKNIKKLCSEADSRKKTELKLQETAEKLDRLVKSFDDIIYTVDNNQVITGVYGHWLSRYNINPSVVIGKKLSEEILIDEADNHIKQHNLAIEGKLVRYEWRGSNLDGEKLFFESILSPLLNKKGQVTGIVGVARELTQLKKMEEQLLDSYKKYQSLTENISDAIYQINSRGIYTYVSPQHKTIFGRGSELVGKSIFTYVHPDDIHIIQKHFDTVKKLSDFKEYKQSAVFRYFHPEKAYIYQEASGSVIKNSKGYVGIVVCRDISQRISNEQKIKDYAERLQKTNQTKDRILSIIGHDLKTPLGTISGFASLIDEQIQKNDFSRLKDFLKLIGSAAENSIRVLNNLLNWATLQSGHASFSPKSIYLETFLQELSDFFAPTIARKNIKFSVQIKGTEVFYGDPVLIDAMIRNFISNAIKYTNEGGSILLEAGYKHNKQFIKIQDNGIGMSEKLRTELFDIEKNTQRPGTNKEVGTGLGLSLCNGIAIMHNGIILVESEEGKGSTFTFECRMPEDNLQP